MVMHVRKTLTKKEVKEYEDWKAKHDAVIKAKAPSKAQKEASRKSFWENEQRAVAERLRGYRRAPSLPPQPEVTAKKNPLLDMDPEEREEYLRREEAAQREIELKKSRVGPTYNKGGPQFWSDGMLEDLKGGGHRRR